MLNKIYDFGHNDKGARSRLVKELAVNLSKFINLPNSQKKVVMNLTRRRALDRFLTLISSSTRKISKKVSTILRFRPIMCLSGYLLKIRPFR